MKGFTLDPSLAAWLDQMGAAMDGVDWMLVAQMPQVGYTSLPTFPPLPPVPADPEQAGLYTQVLVPLAQQAAALVAQLKSYQPPGI